MGKITQMGKKGNTDKNLVNVKKVFRKAILQLEDCRKLGDYIMYKGVSWNQTIANWSTNCDQLRKKRRDEYPFDSDEEEVEAFKAYTSHLGQRFAEFSSELIFLQMRVALCCADVERDKFLKAHR